jgi:hypothetical protein
MVKKPGLGLAVVILVGLSASGCRNSNSSVAPPNRTGLPPWGNGTPTAQSSAGNPAARPGPGSNMPTGPAGFPNGGPSPQFPGAGVTPASATSGGSFGGSPGFSGGGAGMPAGSPAISGAGYTGRPASATPGFAPTSAGGAGMPAPMPVGASQTSGFQSSQYTPAGSAGGFASQGGAPAGYGTGYYDPNQSITVNGGAAPAAAPNWR